MADGGGGGASKTLARIQSFVLPRRIRVREYFVDFDSHKSGSCRAAQFRRALDRFGMTFLPGEVEELVQNYRIPGAAHSVEVSYAGFCADVDQVFADGAASLGASAPAALQTRVPGAHVDRLQVLLERLAMLAKTRGVVFKSCYADFERAPTLTPARITPRQAGKVTRSQFVRLFPFADRFNTEDIGFLAQAFATESGDVHYQAIHDTIAEIGANLPQQPNPADQPFARSDLVLKHDTTEWTHSRLTPMDKLRSKVVEKRVRLFEHFQDFDALRKGACTVGQVKTVFTILDLSKVISKDDFEYITNRFRRADGMFNYRDFCSEADKDFTTPGLEKNPLLSVTMPSPLTTSPGRRNRMALPDEEVQAIDRLHDRICSRVKKHRMLLMPAFRDMDKTRRGHITVSQLARCMVQLNLGLSDAEVELLRTAYCDLGNHTDFNYVEFVQRVDPPCEMLRAAEARRTSPRLGDVVPPKYFDAYGTVRPVGRSFQGTALAA